jgi:hypothetical protein
MTVYERQEQGDADVIRAKLETLAEFIRIWHQRVVTRQDHATVDDMERLREMLRTFHATMPETLEPTYYAVRRLLSDSEFLLVQRDSGYDVADLWHEVIQRGSLTSAHIDRMRDLAR